MAVAALVVGSVLVYTLGISGRVGTVTTEVPQPPGDKPFYMEVTGAVYYAIEVTNDLSIPRQGYSHFLNASVTFMGVEFQTVCPSSTEGCPGYTGGNSTLIGQFVKIRISFPHGGQETLTEAICGDAYSPLTSSHTDPAAGYVAEYVVVTSTCRSYLLVTPYSETAT